MKSLRKQWKWFIQCWLATGVLASGLVGAEPAKIVDLVVGTYTGGGSEGLYQLQFDTSTQRFSTPRLLAKTQNPSFVAIGSPYWYAVEEIAEGQLSVFEPHADDIEPVLKMATGGASPCHIAISPNSAFLAVANYMGGNVSIFQLDKGLVAGEPRLVQHTGGGPNQDRQEAPHAHWVGWRPDGKRLYTVDLGIDEVRVIDPKTGSSQTALKLQPGDGPRHLVFHPTKPWVYIINELSNTLVWAEVTPAGVFKLRGRVNTLPEGFNAHSQAAHIAINRAGDRVYVSNRGHNSIVVFRVGKKGAPSVLQHQSTLGDWPRHFSLVEEAGVLILANEKSHSLRAFEVAADGTLLPTQAKAHIQQPTFVGPFSAP